MILARLREAARARRRRMRQVLALIAGGRAVRLRRVALRHLAAHAKEWAAPIPLVQPPPHCSDDLTPTPTPVLARSSSTFAQRKRRCTLSPRVWE